MGSKAWSHYRGSRLALYTNPPSIEQRWRLHHSRSNEPLAWINPVSLRIYRFHYDGMPPSESDLNFRNSVFIAISMEPCLRPLAVFHLWTRLDCQMETLSNNFCRGSPRCWTTYRPLPGLPSNWREQIHDRRLGQSPSMCTHTWPWAGFVSPLVSRKPTPHKCLEVLDTLQSFRAFFVQPWVLSMPPGALDALDAADLRIETQHGQSYLCRKWIILIIIFNKINNYLLLIFEELTFGISIFFLG